MGRKSKGALPSGNIRIQKLISTDPDGKRHFKSFTGRTRAEAEYKYSQWILNRPEEKRRTLSVAEAITRYIDAKEKVLSPSTVVTYRRIQKSYFSNDTLGAIDISEIETKDIQLWISSLSAYLSPKTVRNAHTLLQSAVKMFRPDFHSQTTLPAKKQPELYCPSDADVKKLLSVIKDRELEIAVLLAAFGPLRRSEICALESTDIKGDIITVSKARVLNKFNEWEIKQPKTYGSYRKIEMPGFVIEKMKGMKGRIITCTPSAISSRFKKALSESGCPHFRFHDLRHYAASIMHAIGVPDQYIMQRGGWLSDNVMKRVYRNVIDAEKEKQTTKIKSHFEQLLK